MKVSESTLAGVLVIEPDVYGDNRGYFLETWARQRYQEAGIAENFVQDNVSRSVHGVLRGLHLQHPMGQGKLVSVHYGAVFDVAVDVRVGSPTFGKWVGQELSEENHRQMYIPPGFAHGFCVLSESALFAYKCTAAYAREHELGIAYNDPDIGIEWPASQPSLSVRDQNNPRLGQIDERQLPRFSG